MNINIEIKNYILNAIDIEELDNDRLLIVSEKKNIILNNVSPELKEKYYDYFSDKFSNKEKKKKSYKKIEWNDFEIEYVKSNIKTLDIKKLSDVLGKSEYQINLLLTKLNIFNKRNWSDNEIEYLKNNINEPSIKLANFLKRSIASIKSKKRILKKTLNFQLN